MDTVGAGSVGYDCARTLVRMGINVNLACLEKGDAILADMEDQVQGREEGIVSYEGRSFEAIEGTPEQVTGLRVHTVISSTYDKATGLWSNVVYMPCTQENGFTPDLPAADSDVSLIYLCFPNNPTGAVIDKPHLQAWVDYANEHGAVIIYDAAYEAYISDDSLPHSIYECDGARTCAIEIRSFSKNAGFTGTRLGYTVVPRDLKDCNGVAMHDLWARRHGTKFNGAPYIIQRAGEAVYSPQGKMETRAQIAFYMENARIIREGLAQAGYDVSGGENAPYIWLKTPDGMGSWEFFDLLLEKIQVVSTPGAGFGPSGEGFLRLTAFGSRESTEEALRRIAELPL